MRLFKTILVLCIVFMIVFPYGKFGPLPIKFMLLLVMSGFGFLTMLLVDKKIRFDLMIFVFFFSFVFPMIWLVIGVVNGNPLANIIDFVNVFPLISIMFFVYLLYDNDSFRGFIHLVAQSVTFVAFLTIILFIVYMFLDPLTRSAVSAFLQPSGLGSGVHMSQTGLVRIILRSNVFIPVNLFLLLGIMRYDPRFKWKVCLLITFLASFTGFNKAFFLGLVLAGAFFVLFQGWFRFKFPLVRDPLIRVMAVLLLMIAVSPLVFRAVGEAAEGLDMSTFSNLVRLEQAEYLSDNIDRGSIWGGGFGAVGENLRRIRYVRKFSTTQYFELEYLHLFLQLGLVGFVIFGLFLGMPLFLYFYYYDVLGQNRYLCSVVMSGYISYLFYAGTNPYIMGSSGFLVIVFAYLIVLFSRKYSSLELMAEGAKK